MFKGINPFPIKIFVFIIYFYWCELESYTNKYNIPSHSLHFLFSGYIGEFEIIDDHRAGKIVVNLTGRLNKVGLVIEMKLYKL